jgi:hypothetical protein
MLQGVSNEGLPPQVSINGYAQIRVTGLTPFYSSIPTDYQVAAGQGQPQVPPYTGFLSYPEFRFEFGVPQTFTVTLYTNAYNSVSGLTNPSAPAITATATFYERIYLNSGFNATYSLTEVVPEPSTITLCAGALSVLCIGFNLRKKRS